jgi:hypothetical protein
MCWCVICVRYVICVRCVGVLDVLGVFHGGSLHHYLVIWKITCDNVCLYDIILEKLWGKGKM